MFSSPSRALWVILPAIVLAAGLVYWLVIRPWLLRWGTTDADVRRSLPGDDLLPHPKMETTHAVTMRASAAEVWLWLVQIGHKRAGWYSYDWLHRLMRVAGSVDDDRRSARQVIPELQHLEVGDSVEIAPGMGFTVVASEPGRALVLHVALDMRTWRPFDPAGTMPDAYLNASWVWFLDEVDKRTTRLIVRTRYDYNPSLLNALMMRVLIGPGGSMMERKTLLSIQQRAEAAARRHGS